MSSPGEITWASVGEGLDRCEAFKFYRVRDGSWFGFVNVLSEIYTGNGRTKLEAIAKALENAAKAGKGGKA